jgi:S1-C subfamily serine protease
LSAQATVRANSLHAAAMLLAPLLVGAASAEMREPERFAERSAPTVNEHVVKEAAQAVVMVKVRARADARSGSELGFERRGSGVVIDRAGHVLTTVHLVLDAETVELVTQGGWASTASVVAQDHMTGVALLRAAASLHVAPIRIGSSRSVGVHEPVLVVAAGESEQLVILGRVAAKRSYSTGWEYWIDEAIIAVPGVLVWDGAALVSTRGELVGIGHLMAFARVGGAISSVNVYVPIDLVRPVLAELIEHGRRTAPQRPWLGVVLTDRAGSVMVTRVMPNSPAERSGLRVGDVILAIASKPVQTYRQLYRALWRSGPAGMPFVLTVLQNGEVREIVVVSTGVESYYANEIYK